MPPAIDPQASKNTRWTPRSNKQIPDRRVMRYLFSLQTPRATHLTTNSVQTRVRFSNTPIALAQEFPKRPALPTPHSSALALVSCDNPATFLTLPRRNRSYMEVVNTPRPHANVSHLRTNVSSDESKRVDSMAGRGKSQSSMGMSGRWVDRNIYDP